MNTKNFTTTATTNVANSKSNERVDWQILANALDMDMTVDTKFEEAHAIFAEGREVEAEYMDYHVVLSLVESKDGEKKIKAKLSWKNRPEGKPVWIAENQISYFHVPDTPTLKNILDFRYEANGETVSRPHSKEDAELALEKAKERNGYGYGMTMAPKKLLQMVKSGWGINIHPPVRKWQLYILLVGVMQVLATGKVPQLPSQ